MPVSLAKIEHIMYVLRTEQKLPISLEQAWDFFSSPNNLKTITPEYMGFGITSELPADGKMYPGLFINYKVSPLLGIKMDWTTEITHVREGQYFVDEQRIGPYRVWHHEHHFESIPGGVLMRDAVHYLPPFGILGKLVHPFLVRPKLEEIFNYRKKKVEELFGIL